MLFTNARTCAITLLQSMESKLNDSGVWCDVLVVHGNLDKNEKFWRVRIFCSPPGSHVEDVSCRVLVCTNATNVGIDNATIDLCKRYGLCWDLCTFLQERGCGLRE